ncbi:hypothetical protein RRG08_033594 [Elysia crispata]|uniref:Uncharacterized protein n=1 Tax=Elysia crispata TaxID=231223 RepID=A0AAE0XR85_9GAST|nr:hypothetical protein RRG08_033594 [Elysia crispata]
MIWIESIHPRKFSWEYRGHIIETTRDKRKKGWKWARFPRERSLSQVLPACLGLVDYRQHTFSASSPSARVKLARLGRCEINVSSIPVNN